MSQLVDFLSWALTSWFPVSASLSHVFIHFITLVIILFFLFLASSLMRTCPKFQYLQTLLNPGHFLFFLLVSYSSATPRPSAFMYFRDLLAL